VDADFWRMIGNVMDSQQELLGKIKALVVAKQYRVRIHAVRHILEEGFDENNLVEALTGKSKIVEDYPYESRCLVLGYFSFSKNAISPLHVICDYANDKVVDLVTAYIPQKPWWITPTQRG
jgi:hypothetical protein